MENDLEKLLARVAQLEKSRDVLLAEKAAAEARNLELQQTQGLLLRLAFDHSRRIIVCDAQTGEVLFESHPMAEHNLEFRESLLAALRAHSIGATDSPAFWEYAAQSQGAAAVDTPYDAITSHPILFSGKRAVAHVITDMTASRREELTLRQMAFSDALTNVHNRRYGMQLAEAYESEKRPFSIAFIDIDRLKWCNDSFGHLEGNNYIIRVANKLKELPDSATVCRVGGDEFMVLTCGADTAELAQALERLRTELVEAPGAYPHSFSYGVCRFDGARPLHEVLECADKRMYAYKFQHKQQRSEA